MFKKPEKLERRESSLKFIRVLGIVLLCIASLAVLLAVVIPIAAILFLSFMGKGIGIALPSSLMRSAMVVYSHPWFSLVIGLGLLIVFGLAARRLARACDQSPD